MPKSSPVGLSSSLPRWKIILCLALTSQFAFRTTLLECSVQLQVNILTFQFLPQDCNSLIISSPRSVSQGPLSYWVHRTHPDTRINHFTFSPPPAISCFYILRKTWFQFLLFIGACTTLTWSPNVANIDSLTLSLSSQSLQPCPSSINMKEQTCQSSISTFLCHFMA